MRLAVLSSFALAACSPPAQAAPPVQAGPTEAASRQATSAVAESAEPTPAEATPAEATPASARRPPKPSAGAPASGDAAAYLAAHNQYRAKHCAPPLAWSAKLATIAQRWANTLRDKGCAFGHSNGDTGENLAAGTSGTLDPESVVKMWYDEISLYKFPNGGFSMKTGHFTQVVWRGTTSVGCARTQCKGMDIFVCEYDPAGNWEGQYRDNVLPVGCKP